MMLVGMAIPDADGADKGHSVRPPLLFAGNAFSFFDDSSHLFVLDRLAVVEVSQVCQEMIKSQLPCLFWCRTGPIFPR